MVGTFFKITLLMQLLRLIAEVAGESPCPNYFWYVRDSGTGEISGRIEIPSPPTGIALHLSVGLSIAIALPTKYVGRLELAKSKEKSIKAVQQGRPLKYRIHFPLREPIPVLTGLWFNNAKICSGPRAMGQIVTSIVLNHTLYPPGVMTLSENTGDHIPYYPKVDTTTTPEPTHPTRPTRLPWSPRPFWPSLPSAPSTVASPVTAVPHVEPNLTINVDNMFFNPNKSTEPQCGQSYNMNKINPLISRGVKTSPGQWPWLVAIFVVKLEFEFQCAGTLVTNTHILTAAHCLQLDSRTIPSGAMLVSLGRYRLRDWRERGSVNREVAEYTIHPDYNHRTGNADADLAVMVLRERVEYSTVIRPICLWSGATNLENVVGKMGYVAGWGRDELGNPYVQEPRMASIPIVSQETCLWSNESFVKFTSNRTFCAGMRNGVGPCNGDSGSGFVMYDPNTRSYHLRGVVSRSLLDSTTNSCDLTQYVIYSDVAKHLDWIREQIAT